MSRVNISREARESAYLMVGCDVVFVVSSSSAVYALESPAQICGS